MKVAIDIRNLQQGSQFRGIGEVTKKAVNKLLENVIKDNNQHTFIFCLFKDEINPLELLTIPKLIKYELFYMGPKIGGNHKFSKFERVTIKYKKLFGNPFPKLKADIFIQFDFNLSIPKNIPSILLKYDLIPLIYEKYYLAKPRILDILKNGLKFYIRYNILRYEYFRIIQRQFNKALKIICISEHTKQDLIKYFNVDENKLIVSYLGYEEKFNLDVDKIEKNKIKKIKNKFILTIGAPDPIRRTFEDVVYAFNLLKADYDEIQLVLVGFGLDIKNKYLNNNLENSINLSSYKKDILGLGYVNDETKNYLLKHSTAFIFPSHYEGFGLPIIEAMSCNCPIVTYNNSSIKEISKDHVFYAKDWLEIYKQLKYIFEIDKEILNTKLVNAKSYAAKFTWDDIGNKIYKEINNL